MEYKILNATSPDEMEKQVNDFLGKGWSLYGELTVSVVSVSNQTEVAYFQVVTKG